MGAAISCPVVYSAPLLKGDVAVAQGDSWGAADPGAAVTQKAHQP